MEYQQGNGGDLVLLLTMKGEGELAEAVFREVTAALPSADFTLEVYEVSDWDGELSPWPYEMPEGRHFAGNGKSTIEAIGGYLDKLAPKFERVLIAGYSLAGLFSLWAVRETAWFDGCACCSGSLWYEGWEEYAIGHPLKKPGCVYLSLGGREEKAKNPVIAAIGAKTREEDQRLAQDAKVTRHTLVMNSGGHFASPERRLAQGILWLLKERKA